MTNDILEQLKKEDFILNDPNVAWPDEQTGGFAIDMGSMEPMMQIACGPLLRLCWVDYSGEANANYTIMIVVKDGVNGRKKPMLKLRVGGLEERQVEAQELHSERDLIFYRFKIQIKLGMSGQAVHYSINKSNPIAFHVPAASETMNIMFHSCNGFSSSVNPETLSGPSPLWRDVLRAHEAKPIHVMLGGGDQIYNDGLPKKAPLFRAWLSMKNLGRKHTVPFSDEMRDELERFYLEHYCVWFHQGSFSEAAARIPMINVWDDHDIIDGYGSYPDHFMRCSVFSNLGRVAFKYYTLFQGQSLPTEEIATWDKSVLIGSAPGPYMEEFARSFVTWLGPEVLFVGMDNRTERTRLRVNYEATYDLLFNHINKTITGTNARHIIFLLGIPIAYPRLVWLENILTSRLMDPVKVLARRGILRGFLNQFDRGVEILDDLDDHWTAKHHKKERNALLRRLQSLSKGSSARITLLGGDVHLGAIGEFYTKKSLNVSKEHDHRYMLNIISSAITNTPPNSRVSNLLHLRNKVHHLDTQSDEQMVRIFLKDVDGQSLKNTHLMPRLEHL